MLGVVAALNRVAVLVEVEVIAFVAFERPEVNAEEHDNAANEGDHELPMDAERVIGVHAAPAPGANETAEVGIVGEGTARHDVQLEEMHGEERRVEADEDDPQGKLAPELVNFTAKHQRKPIVDAGQQAEEGAADEDVVEVGDHEITVLLL